MEQTKNNPQEAKKIYHDDFTEVLDINGKTYINQLDPSVIILPYVIDSSGNPLSIGIISEISQQRSGGIFKTLIIGTPDESDDDILKTAIREFKEESGIDVPDMNRWKFLGSIYTSKLVVNSNPCFSVNITDLEPGPKDGDGSIEEKDTKFEIIPIEDALLLDDALISCLFIKNFKDLF